MPTRGLLLSALAICLAAGAPPAAAFRACTNPVTLPSGPLSGHWPDPANTTAAGTRKWAFDWRVNLEGLEVSNVRYTSVLGQPTKLVLS